MNRQNQLGMAVRSTLATCVVAAGAMMVLPAVANISGNATGGASCQASNGNGAKLFYFSNLFAQNTSTSSQYLSCNFNDSEDAGGDDAVAANIVVLNPTGAAFDVTCVIQSGTPGNGTIYTHTKVQTAGASSLTEFIWTAGTIPQRDAAFNTYSASCLMPPQSQLGLLRLWVPGNFAA